VRHVYEYAERPLGKPLPLELEQQALAKLQHRGEDWQVKQARHALRLYRYFLNSQTTPDKSHPRRGCHEAWNEVMEKVRRVMRLQHKSLHTEKTYLLWLRRFASFAEGKSPGQVGEDDVTSFLSSLAVEGNVSVATQKQALNALVFVFRCGLEREPGNLSGAVQARYHRRIPTVLTVGEVHQLFDKMDGVARPMAQLIYGSGLRLFECLRLRVESRDFCVIVSGNHQSHPLLVQRMEQFVNLPLAVGIQATSGFVEEQQSGIAKQAARKGQALFHPCGVMSKW